MLRENDQSLIVGRCTGIGQSAADNAEGVSKSKFFCNLNEHPRRLPRTHKVIVFGGYVTSRLVMEITHQCVKERTSRHDSDGHRA